MIGIGTRWSDFTTASKSAFQDPGVRFVNVNVASFDAAKLSGLTLVSDARAALIALGELLHGWRVEPTWEMRATEEAEWWTGEVRRLVPARDRDPDRGAGVLPAARCDADHHLVLRPRRLGSDAPARQPGVIGRPVSQAIGARASAAVQVLASGWARLA